MLGVSISHNHGVRSVLQVKSVIREW